MFKHRQFYNSRGKAAPWGAIIGTEAAINRANRNHKRLAAEELERGWLERPHVPDRIITTVSVFFVIRGMFLIRGDSTWSGGRFCFRRTSLRITPQYLTESVLIKPQARWFRITFVILGRNRKANNQGLYCPCSNMGTKQALHYRFPSWYRNRRNHSAS
jgi:hypothetical protein